MENAAPDLTPTSSETDTDQEGDNAEQCADAWPSDTESASTQSSDRVEPGLLHVYGSPPLEGLPMSSVPYEGSREQTKDAHAVFYVKDDRASPQWRLSPGSQDGDTVPQFPVQTPTTWKKASVPDPPSDRSSDVDLEKGLHSAQAKETGGERDEDDDQQGECRVCHLPFDSESVSGEAMELGCDCKEDLSLAHRHCAEAWFKIKGNRACEICGATAQNIMGVEDSNFMDQWNDRDAGTSTPAEPASCWESQSLCSFLLACMVIAFILPWLFRVIIV